MRGRIKWFNDTKGYGFIERSDGEDDLFVHFSGIDMPGYKTLAEGDYVEYEVREIDEGLRAINVSKY